MKKIHALVACSDLTGYAKISGQKSEEEIFALLSDYYEFVGDIIAPASGTVVKFMGDAALMLFPDESVDSGVKSLLTLQIQGDAFLAKRGVSCRHHIRAHFGPVCFGPIGTRSDKRSDILGATVNALFLLKTSGFALTPETFQKLKPERESFLRNMPLPSLISPRLSLIDTVSMSDNMCNI